MLRDCFEYREEFESEGHPNGWSLDTCRTCNEKLDKEENANAEMDQLAAEQAVNDEEEARSIEQFENEVQHG